MKIKNFLVLTIFLLIIFMTSNVFAATTTMEIVENNICTIKLTNSTYFEKKIIDSDLTNNQVTLQLKISNDSELLIPSGELILVIDSSSSMDTIVSGTQTRKDLVLDSANQLVELLLEANSTSLDIGVVTFSTGTETDPDTGYLITGTEADAQTVCDFTNDPITLTESISAIEGTGQYTNLDAGLQLARDSFTSEDNNKYIIVLTDGLPNLAVGYNDLVSYEGLTDVIEQTKSTLTSLDGIEVITMLTGIDNEDAVFRTDGTNSYTYGQVIEAIFGTETEPTVGTFYNISDDEIEETITENIYYDLSPIAYSVTDITVVDYFPQDIVDNFEITYVDGIDVSNVSAEIDTDTNSIVWTIDELAPGETAIIQYTLTLKDDFDESIIDQILDTNENVEITYTDYNGTTQTLSSDVTPTIRITQEETDNTVVDDTVSTDSLPDTGLSFVIIGSIALIGLAIFFKFQSREIK